VNDLSLRIVSYLNNQLSLPPSLTIRAPERKATYTAYRKNILTHLGFRKFTESAQQNLQIWLEEKAKLGILPKDLFHQAEKYLLGSYARSNKPKIKGTFSCKIGVDQKPTNQTGERSNDKQF
jgi:hypothetical protein